LAEVKDDEEVEMEKEDVQSVKLRRQPWLRSANQFIPVEE